MKTKAEKLLAVNMFKRYRGNWATFNKVAHMHDPGQASGEEQIAAAPGETGNRRCKETTGALQEDEHGNGSSSACVQARVRWHGAAHLNARRA